MAHPSLVESLFIRRRSRNLSMFSTAKDSDDSSVIEEVRVKVRFNLVASTPFGWEIRVVGNQRELGNWNVSEGVPLVTAQETYPVWTSSPISFHLPSLQHAFEYKYIMVHQGRNEVRWESTGPNRTAHFVERTPRNYIIEINDQFSKHSKHELKIMTKSDFTQALSRIPFLSSLEQQLNQLTDLLMREAVTYNTLALGCIVIKNMKNPVGSDYSAYSSFIEWCSGNISVQQTKLLLGATSPSYMWLAIPTSGLVEKIEAYQDCCHSTQDDILHQLTLGELRMALLNEYTGSEDVAGLLITDTYLEKNELELLERIIESIEEDEVWKIVLVGLWIAQMLYLNCVKPKQSSVMISQFEKLRRQESAEILRDLLNELLALVLEIYAELYTKVQHQECEALAALLQSEYKILYHGIFQTCSQYLLKVIPILNGKLLKIPFMCYQSGNCKGYLKIAQGNSVVVQEDIILVAAELTEEFELPENAKAFVVIYAEDLYHQSLMQARKKNIPVAVGYFPPLVEGKYIVNVIEDSFTIQRAE